MAYDEGNYAKILQDDEPKTVYTDSKQRSFHTGRTLQTKFTDNGQLHVRFYSPRSVSRMKIMTRIPAVSNEFFDLAYFDSIPAFADFYNDVVVNNATYFSWTGGENTSLIIDARDPDFVYIMDDFYSGLTTTVQGQAFAPHFYSIVDINMEYYGFSLDQLKQQAPESFGQMKDGVIRFPAAHVGFTFGDFDPEVGVYSGNDATLAVALPGYVISDYSSSFAYSGCFIDIMGNSYIQGTVTLGDDVASAKYVIAANGDDVDAIIEAVNDGSIEATDITGQLCHPVHVQFGHRTG